MGWDGGLVDRWGDVDRDSANTAEVNEGLITYKFLSSANIKDLAVLVEDAESAPVGDAEPTFPTITLGNTSETGIDISSAVGLGTVISFTTNPIYNTVEYLHSTSVNTSRIQVIRDGIFLLKGLIAICGPSGAGQIEYYGDVAVAVNGILFDSTSQGYVFYEDEAGVLKVSATLSLTAGDYIEIYVKRLGSIADCDYVPKKTTLNITKISPSEAFTFLKEPNVPLTGPSSGGYIVTSSVDDGTNYPWHAFDGTKTGMWSAGNEADFTENDIFPGVDSQYLKIEVPVPISLAYITYYNDVDPNIGVQTMVIFASNDDTTWTVIGETIYIGEDSDNTVPNKIRCDPGLVPFKYIAFVIMSGSLATGDAGISELEMYYL